MEYQSTPYTERRSRDPVLVTNEITPPGKWPVGIVNATYPGKDNLTRVVDVKTTTTTLKRPIVKLGLLKSKEDLTG